MAFEVSDFREMLRLLDEHPEWKREMRRVLLTDELLALPEIVRELAERVEALAVGQLVLTERLDALTQRVDALTQRVDALTQRVDALTQRVDALTAGVADLTREMRELARKVQKLTDRMDEAATTEAWLKGESIENRYREKGNAYFSRIARRLRLVSRSDVAEMVDDALQAGILDEHAADRIVLTDAVFRGRRREDGSAVVLLAEISWTVDISDVVRAQDRAADLSRLGTPVVPVVAGNAVTAEASELAARRGVHVVLDGREAASA